jgi:hypothetical protein
MIPPLHRAAGERDLIHTSFASCGMNKERNDPARLAGRAMPARCLICLTFLVSQRFQQMPTPALARKIWEGMPNASTRRVARKLRQAGGSISHQTVARWRNQGWRPLEGEQQHPLEAARASLDDAVPLLTGNPSTTANSIVQESAEREALEQSTDAVLLRKAAREVLTAICLIARAVMLRPEVMATRPAEVGFLMLALAKCFQAATAALGQSRNIPSH